MDDVLQLMRCGPRKIAVTGHFGSGKTEFAVSLAFALAAQRAGEALALCDRVLAHECDTVVEVISTNPIVYKGRLPV